jgi:hypothetical protein
VEAHVRKLFQIKVTLTPPNPSEIFGAQAQIYMQGVDTIFRTSVFKFLELLIKYGRRKTGRLVAGFTSMMDAHQYDYMRSWQHSDTEDARAVQEGKNLSMFDETIPGTITITNAVEYAEYVENKVGMTERGQLPVLIPYFEKFFGENMDQFMKNAANGGFEKGDFGILNDFGAPEI